MRTICFTDLYISNVSVARFQALQVQKLMIRTPGLAQQFQVWF